VPHRTRRRPNHRGGLAVALVLVTVLGGLGACTGDDGGSGDRPHGATSSTAPADDPGRIGTRTAGDVVELRPLTTRDGRIVDDLGRDVLLRGANVNSLGEYWQGVDGLPATLPVGDADWDAMAAHGFSAVRLLITWSRVEPERDRIDAAYLDEVDAQVTAAAARGIYTVLDMHQDAYSAFISTEDPAGCPPGTEPAKGWDGAPRWATLTDGLSTCLEGDDRNSSPAVTRAWNNFYEDRDGIRTRFAAAWAAVAARFAGRAEVAGFDLLNEPETSAPAAELTPRYEAFLRQTATAIRDAQADAPFRHLLLVEPALPAGHLDHGLVIPNAERIGLGTDGVVSAPHNYAESIDAGGLGLTIETMMETMVGLGSARGVPTWIGEYGFWDTEPATLEKVARYAETEDRYLLGGAWWGWRQSCGDPHSVRWEDGEVVAPDGAQVHLNTLDCPANTDAGPTDAFLRVLGRGYPRAVPGEPTALVSDPETGRLEVEATASADDVGEQLLVWTPTEAAGHEVRVEGLRDLTEHPVPGGRLLTATVAAAGPYASPSPDPPTGSR